MIKNRPDECNLFIGTSGYSYGEWINSGFYPPGTHSSNMLDIYIKNFHAAELNYTWYQMPKAPAMKRMCAKVPQHFKFAAKLTRTMTHEVKKLEWQNQVFSFRLGIEPLIQSKKLLCVLIQLPPWFKRTIKCRHYLAALLDELSGLPIAVEFRHDSWVNDKVFYELENRKITIVSVDAPKLPGLFPLLDVVTNPSLFYIRLHGRNARGWGSNSMQQQFDYDYKRFELKNLADSIQKTIMPKTMSAGIFFNNHVRGQAPRNALAMMKFLYHKRLRPKREDQILTSHYKTSA